MKTVGLETNPQKQTVRDDLVRQMAHLSNGEKISVFTLPAANAFFEKMLHNYFTERNIPLAIYCAEKNIKTFRAAKANVPPTVKIWQGGLNRVIYKQVLEKGRLCDVIWADFCHAITLKDIKQCIDTIRYVMTDEGIYYITTNLSGAHIVNGKRGVWNMLNDRDVNAPCQLDDDEITTDLLRNKTIALFEEGLKKAGIKRVQKVYDVLYTGGVAGNVPMLTVGFAIGIDRHDDRFPPIILENRRKKFKSRKKFCDNITKSEKVRILLDDGCEDKTIMKEVGISRMSLAAYKANISRKR